jgi:hypothetical protein
MKTFYPSIMDYELLIDPTLDDFIKATHEIIIPKERTDNYVFIDPRQKLRDPDTKVLEKLFWLNQHSAEFIQSQ